MQKKEQQKKIGFFYQGYHFTNNLIYLSSINDTEKANKAALENIKIFAENQLIDLFNLSSDTSNYPIVKHYCYLPEQMFTDFWDNLLTSGEAFKQLKITLPDNFSFKPQKNIHSFDLLKGFFWFHKAFKLECERSNTILISCLYEGIAYFSCLAGALFLDLYMSEECMREEACLFPQYDALEDSLKTLAELNLTPGYLLLAKFYFYKKDYLQCLSHITTAKSYLFESANEINNANETVSNMINALKSLEDAASKHYVAQQIASLEIEYTPNHSCS